MDRRVLSTHAQLTFSAQGKGLTMGSMVFPSQHNQDNPPKSPCSRQFLVGTLPMWVYIMSSNRTAMQGLFGDGDGSLEQVT